MTLMPMVFAHVFAGDGGPGAGFMHPLTGADHLVAMFCIGVLSARIGGRAIWTVPSVFVSMMLVGGLAGMRGIDLPAPELGIAVSVLGVGALLALGDRTTAMLACVAAAFFGLYHGFAHGREMPLVSSAALYALGFVVSTAGLHVAGALTGALTLCRPTGAARLRVAGAVVGMAGVIFAARALGLSALAWRALP